ncbi:MULTISPECIES: TRAP transporter small permease [unclassified Alcanivorax]|jgi:TRAP-type C4-dicarboxylate transport system permease small subunit|uniref:TRAP transporter small permease n=1 Tax=unclassified Alcanivorax TaxID=2638842 RepID=UPI000789FC5E|nr:MULTISPECIES: TRAP transporter small permease [unclassified Alcanivorax]MEE2601687.1 TRAP transporter small permease [Pseudomonadota bacterium]MBB11058.1 TRAP transporter small permease [Alcanivorax sp.]MBU84346.1 TRAP transporter small permease [Alcanivorax sp.]MEE3387615.1 TRAP transporter small permease [Pseudomonadota bacterium]SEG00989.1 TRAP-type C4-dicarboxylate transport system, small permease component [Alcanivorax sp. DSM 26293]|tara:strand:- start:328 stop:903 length:576 start_codon:yes stop_codon:yes gene_type:complete
MNDEAPSPQKSSLPGFLGTLDNGIAKVEAIILATGVLLMAINTVANVVGRFLLGESLHFSEEVNRILIVMITFAGLGYAARHGRHIRMSAIYDIFPTNIRRLMMILISFVTSAIMFFLCWYSVSYIHSVYSTGRVLPTLGFPIYLIYLWVPVGLTVTGIQYFMAGIKNIFSRDVYLSTTVLDGYDEQETEI